MSETHGAVLERPRQRKRARRASSSAAIAGSVGHALAMEDSISAQSEIEDTGPSYWPLLRASMGAALLTLVAQCVSAVWLALQAGHSVSLGLWKVIPYLRISTTSLAAFNHLVFWSSVASAVVLGVFGTLALVRKNPLQTQLGRSFAFLDISLIGTLAMVSARWFGPRQSTSNWMLNLALGGAISFAVAAWLVNDRVRERDAERAAASELSGCESA